MVKLKFFLKQNIGKVGISVYNTGMSTEADNKLIRLGLNESRNITKEYARTFYFASLFLPAELRNSSYAVYSVCRISDNAADKIDDKKQSRKDLLEISNNIESAYNGSGVENSPLLFAFHSTVRKHKIPREYFTELLEGMNMDLDKARYEDFTRLYDYCYKVAGVVGLIMLEIFGYSDPEAKKHATELGVAMQLTNILRDIKEDFQRGRIYLPQGEMKQFNITEGTIARQENTPELKELLRFNISRARGYYKQSSRGFSMITNKQSRFVAAIMKELYSGILDKIEENGYDVFSKRAHLNGFEKMSRLCGILFRENTIKNKKDKRNHRAHRGF